MQIVGAWHVTNMAKEPIHMHSAHIVRPRKARTSGEVFVLDPQTNCAGDGFLAPRSTAQALTQFFIHPPICKAGEDFKAKIVFTDQFRNKHKTKWVVFTYS